MLDFFAELALDVAPDLVAGVADRLKEAAGGLGDGFEIADEGGAVGIAGEEILQPRVLADLAVAVGEELGKVLLELFGLEGVEVDFAWKLSFRDLRGHVRQGRLAGMTKQFAKPEAGLVQLGFAVACRAIEHGGDLIMLEAFDIVEDKDHAVAGR